MITAIKAELRKLLTVRSTYVILLLCLVLEALFAFYGDGYKAQVSHLRNPGYLANEVVLAVTFLSGIIALAGVLLVTHEYRYNTIMYSLTSSNRRYKVLLAKLLVISVFAIIATIIFGCLSPVFASLGLHAKGHHLVHQVIPYKDLLWRIIFYGWGYSMLGLILAFIIRVQVGAFVALFLIPGTLEPLLGLLLKKNVQYLPFRSLTEVVDHGDATISYRHAAMVASLYIVIGWIIALILFQRRDAN